jgi:hypothetical protein
MSLVTFFKKRFKGKITFLIKKPHLHHFTKELDK